MRSVANKTPYLVEPWTVRETSWDPSRISHSETIFAVSNGFLGLRGNLEEGEPVYQFGTLINGFYETYDYVYPEWAYGFAPHNQVTLNVTDGKMIRLFVNGEKLNISTGKIINHERVLDMRTGIVTRRLEWESPSGHLIRLKSRRFVSFLHKHLGAIQWTVEAVNETLKFEIRSELAVGERDDDSQNLFQASSIEFGDEDPRRGKAHHDALIPVLASAVDTRLLLGHRTLRSRLGLVAGAEHRVESDFDVELSNHFDDNLARVTWKGTARPGEKFSLTKFLSYHDTNNGQDLTAKHKVVNQDLDRNLKLTFDGLRERQMHVLEEFWSNSDIVIEGDDKLQQAIRFALFQVFQSACKAEGRGIPAKGLTGLGYDGHYFWDMDTFACSMLSFTAPELTKNAILYRHSLLPKARKLAKRMDLEGALFPWRTIRGEESSAFFLAGTAQFHINADIAFALRKYVNATGDLDLLYEQGAEILIETARMWHSFGFFTTDPDGNNRRFEIHGVTGPDEYSAMGRNNAYTNLMARRNLLDAAETLEEIRTNSPERYQQLVKKLKIEEGEVVGWRDAGDNMYLHYDEDRQLHGQDQHFLSLEEWDFAGTPRNKYPLLLHFHPLVIYRHQVIKQTDLVLAMLFCPEFFTPEQKLRNFDYYDKRTTGDSSLSASIQSVMAAEVGHLDLAYAYAAESARVDIDDIQHNVGDGVHLASMAGTWMSFIHGFGGMRDDDGKITFNPQLPKNLSRICFKVQYRKRIVQVDMDKQQTTYSLVHGEPLEIWHQGQPLKLFIEKPISVDMDR